MPGLIALLFRIHLNRSFDWFRIAGSLGVLSVQ